jgi:hypothetical protein
MSLIPSSPILLVISLIQLVVTGFLVGGLSGGIGALMLKNGRRGIIYDAALGAISFTLVLVLFALLPWPRNTITYNAGAVEVASTMDRYQHPFWLAYPAAIVLPILYESYRCLKRRRQTDPPMPRIRS